MTETAQEVVPVVETPKEEVLKDDVALKQAREAERTRYTREESLRRELEETKRKLETVKKNGWDLDVLSQKQRTSGEEFDAKKELQEIKQELVEERARRSEIEELQAIVDFTQKNPEYELIRQLEDAPKYIRYAMQEHFKKTGKYLSYADACNQVEETIEKAETDRFDRFSKTKKAEKIYKLQSAVAAKAEPTKPTEAKLTPKVTPQDMVPEPKNLQRSNSKEAFNFFRKKYGL